MGLRKKSKKKPEEASAAVESDSSDDDFIAQRAAAARARRNERQRAHSDADEKKPVSSNTLAVPTSKSEKRPVSDDEALISASVEVEQKEKKKSKKRLKKPSDVPTATQESNRRPSVSESDTVSLKSSETGDASVSTTVTALPLTGVEAAAGRLFVEVIVVEGRELVAKDKRGTSDPFVKLRLLKREAGQIVDKTRVQKTKTVFKTLSPKWVDERFSLEIPGGLESDSLESWSLQVEVFDYDRVGAAEFMGRISLPLQTVALEQRTAIQQRLASRKGAAGDPQDVLWRDHWYDLETNEKKVAVTGAIRLQLRLKEIEIDANATESSAKALKKFRSRFPHLPSEVQVDVDHIHTARRYVYKGVPMQGTLYIANFYVCFYVNSIISAVGTLATFGKKRKEVIKLIDVVDIVRADSVMLIPDAIKIFMDDGSHYFFGGLFSRDAAYEALRKNWKAALKSGRDVDAVTTASPAIERGVSKRSLQDDMPVISEPIHCKVVQGAKGKKNIKVVLDATRTCAENMRLFVAAPLGIGPESIGDFELFHTKPSSKHLVRMRADKKISTFSAVAAATAEHPAKLHLVKPERKKFKAGKIEQPVLPFASFAEKIGIANRKTPRPSDEVCLEIVLHCVDFPLSEPLKAETPGEREAMISSLLNSLQQGFGVSDDAMAAARRRVLANGGRGQDSSFIVASQLVDIRHRLRRLGWAVAWQATSESASAEPSPFYCLPKFADPADFGVWRKLELAQILNEAEQLVFPAEGFYGRLIVTVVSATGLPAKDVTGTSDPYVVVVVEEQREKTKFKSKTLSPVWNQALEFGVTDPEGTINIDVFDHDYTSSDDYMASITLQIKVIRSIPDAIEQTFDLHDADGKPAGSITLAMQFDFAHVDVIREIYDASLNDVYHASLLEVEKSIDHHSNYLRVLKILLFETFSGIHLLAPASEWLLEELGERFGVHWPYRKLAYLESVGMILEPHADELGSVEDALTSISRVRALGEVLSNAETRMHVRSFEQLESLFETYCIDYRSLFPHNKPSGGVSAICESMLVLYGSASEDKIRRCILQSIDKISARQHAEARALREDGANGPSPAEMIQLCDSVEREILEAEQYARAFPRTVDILKLVTCRHYHHLQQAVLQFCQEAEFSMDVFQFYFRLAELQELVAAKASNGKKSVQDWMDQPAVSEGSGGADDPYELRLLSLPTHFARFIYRWLKVTMNKLVEWSDTARLHDDLKPMTEDIVHSSSVHDTFSGVSEALQFLRSLETQDPFVLVQFAEVVCRVAEVYSRRMADQIITLLPSLEKRKARAGDKRFLHLPSVPWNGASPASTAPSEEPIQPGQSVDLPVSSHRRTKSTDDKTKALVVDPFILKTEYIVAVNNVEDARGEMNRIVGALEEELEARSRWPNAQALAIHRHSFDACVKEGFASVKGERDRLLDALVERISHYVAFVMISELAHVSKHNISALTLDPSGSIDTPRLNEKAREHLTDLLSYLDAQLTELSDHLSPVLFKLALKNTFTSIGNRLRLEIFPVIQATDSKGSKHKAPPVAACLMNKAEARALVAAFDSLKDFFHAEGDGLDMVFMNEQVGFLDTALHLWDRPTRELLIKFVELTESPSAGTSDLCPGHVLQMLEGRRETDVLARSFLREQQDPAYHAKQQQWRRDFLLEGGELMLAEWAVSCKNSGKTGTAYLTSSFVLFDARFSHGADDGNQIVIELLRIKSVRRTTKRLGVMDVVTITMDDDEVYEFNSLLNREQMANDIYEHAVRSGNRTIQR